MFIVALGIGIVGYLMILVGKTANQAIFSIFGTIMTTIAAILFFVNAFM